MILCDVGNTNAHILVDNQIIIKNANEFLNFNTNDEVFYICVNESLKAQLKKRANFFDMEQHVKFQTNYTGLGIDRICACKSVKNGVVVDAGTAITIDVMEDGFHKGGFIFLGLKAQKNAYIAISSKLDKEINFDICFEFLPQNTQDAISYAVLQSIELVIKSIAKDKMVYFTGGDGEKLSRFFKNSIYDEMLVFKGLGEIIAETKKGIK